jgi:deoxyribose-phosphate aldolase
LMHDYDEIVERVVREVVSRLREGSRGAGGTAAGGTGTAGATSAGATGVGGTGVAGKMPSAPCGPSQPSGTGACAVCVACGKCVERAPQAVENIKGAGAARISASPGIAAVGKDVAPLIDHTLLKPDASRSDVEKLCREAREFGFASVCINPCWVKLAAGLLAGTAVKVCSVIGFPLGAAKREVKAYEARRAILDGAREIDMVMNVGAMKSQDYKAVQEDMRDVKDACGKAVVTKVILETALLTDPEKVKACEIAKRAGMDFVKTSTGFGPGGATVDDIKLMRGVVGEKMGIKAAGGIRDADTAARMIEAGATRIGASASVKIVGG